MIAACSGTNPVSSLLSALYGRRDLRLLQVVVLETEAAKKSTAQILELHGIPADRSPDLQAKR